MEIVAAILGGLSVGVLVFSTLAGLPSNVSNRSSRGITAFQTREASFRRYLRFMRNR